ncbi:MAG: type IX secretion system outer membrane channel protein PorV [Bacteroidaceae bacterium]|nr:type IX secretion system outer membrane channel protein PorV [Bacteroidaceae bacterium]
MNRLSYCVFSLLSLAAAVAHAEDIKNKFNPVQTAVVSQSIAADAHAGGMGDIGAATEPDANSQAWNAAKYPFCISKAGVAVNYTPWLRQLVNDIDLAYLAGYYRLGDYQAVSASLRYFSLGEVYYGTGTTSQTGNEMTIKPYEFAVDAAYSRMLSEQFSAAVTFRYIYSDLSGHYDDGSTPGSAFAVDLATYYNTYMNVGARECQFALGLGIYNLGSKIDYGDDYSFFIPTTLRLGANFMVPLNEYNRISFAAEANKLLVPTYPTDAQCAKALGYSTTDGEDHTAEYQTYREDKYYSISPIKGIFKSFNDAPNGFKEELEEIQWSVGAEYTYNDKFMLRAGYHHESANKGNRKYFTVGAGFRMNVFSLDAGYVISTAASNPLDQTLRVSLGFDFDGIRDLFTRGR